MAAEPLPVHHYSASGLALEQAQVLVLAQVLEQARVLAQVLEQAQALVPEWARELVQAQALASLPVFPALMALPFVQAQQ